MLTLPWARAAAWRVRRHYLDRRAGAGSMLAVASRLCGLHAQVLSSAELTLWARVEGLDRRAVRRALWEDRTLVKTWAMWGTLHLLPASELPVWHAALGTSRRYLSPARWQRYFGITMGGLDRLTRAIGAALRGRVLTRAELGREVGRITGSAALAQGRLGHPPEAGRVHGPPVFWPRPRPTRPDTWAAAGVQPAVDPRAATVSVARRYLAAYGPATYHDLARWWNGGGVSTAREWSASLGDEVVPVEVEGARAWILAAHARGCATFHHPGRSACSPGSIRTWWPRPSTPNTCRPAICGAIARRAGFPRSSRSTGSCPARGATASRAAVWTSSSSRSSRSRRGCAVRPSTRPSASPRFFECTLNFTHGS